MQRQRSVGKLAVLVGMVACSVGGLPQLAFSDTQPSSLVAEATARPLSQRWLSADRRDAVDLHFAFHLEILNSSTCAIHITYNEFGTNFQRPWQEPVLVFADTAAPPARTFPQPTLRNVPYSFAFKAIDAPARGLRAPAFEITVASPFLEEEANHIQHWDPHTLMVVQQSEIIDLRVLRDIAAVYRLVDQGVFVIRIGRAVARGVSPWILLADVTISVALDYALEAVVDAVAKIYVKSVQVECVLCGTRHMWSNVANGQRLGCPGCDMAVVLRWNEDS